MDWYENDELRKQWEEASMVEEKLRQKKVEGDVLQDEPLQWVPGLDGRPRRWMKK